MRPQDDRLPRWPSSWDWFPGRQLHETLDRADRSPAGFSFDEEQRRPLLPGGRLEWVFTEVRIRARAARRRRRQNFDAIRPLTLDPLDDLDRPDVRVRPVEVRRRDHLEDVADDNGVRAVSCIVGRFISRPSRTPLHLDTPHQSRRQTQQRHDSTRHACPSHPPMVMQLWTNLRLCYGFEAMPCAGMSGENRDDVRSVEDRHPRGERPTSVRQWPPGRGTL